MISLLNIKKGYGLFFIFGACGFFIGLFLFFGLVMIPFYDYGRSMFWDKVPTVILEKDMVEVSGGRRHSYPSYRPEISYTYTYEGSRYVNNDVSNYDNVLSKDPNWLDRELEHSRQGVNTFVAWVNPSNPSESYLVRNIWKSTTFLGTLMGVVFAFVGLILVRISLVKAN